MTAADGRSPHPALPGQLIGTDDQIVDRDESWPVLARSTPYSSPFISVHDEVVLAPDGAELKRTFVDHPGAVAVAAVDDDDRVLMLTQYRHPVRRRLFEIPAGLLDVPGETPRDAAARELAEEADLVAQEWELLATLHSSPGFSNERLHLYSARDLSPVAAADRTTRLEEEADMTALWVPLADAVDAVLSSRLSNELTATAVLATYVRASRRAG